MSWKLKRKMVATIVALASSSVALTSVVPTHVAAQPQPAFAPVARVEPTQPVRLQLINRSNQPVDFILVTQTNSRRLAAGSTTQLSNFPLPAYLNINPIRDRTAVRYAVSAKSNTATIEIFSADYGGNRSLNIDQTGGIYIY